MKAVTPIISTDCPKVSGYLASCFYDLTRHKYYISANFENLKSLDKAFFDFLVQEEIIIYVPTEVKNRFSRIDFNYESPSLITSCVTEFKDISHYKLLLDLNCFNFAVKLSDVGSNLGFIKELLTALNNTPINFLEFHLTDTSVNHKELIELNELHSNFAFAVFRIYSENAIEINKFYSEHASCSVFCRPLRFLKNADQRMNFFVNLEQFCESQLLNSYFNQKIFINSKGEIGNSLFDSEVFGNISTIKNHNDLLKIITSKKFQKYWQSNKGLTDICKDCEFRNMCVDSRVPTKRKDGTWYHTTQCNYNPYIAKWSDEDGYVSIEDCGILSSEQGFSINKRRLDKIIKEIWD